MTQWEQYVSYFCRHLDCGEQCLNLIHSPFAQTKQCRECFAEHDPDELTPLSHHLPDSSSGEIPVPSSSD